jgi:glycosyltransferase involved in cell wall biosynthesis
VRILHLCHGYPPATGGSEVLIAELSRRLARDYGHDVTVVTTTAYTTAAFRRRGEPVMAPGEETDDGVRVRRHQADPRLAPRIERLQFGAHRWRLPLNGVLRTVYDGPLAPGMLRDACTLPADVIGATAFPLLHMYAAVAAGRARRVPTVLWGAVHPEDRWGYDRGLIRRAIAAGDAYAANTTYERDHLVAWGIEPERIAVIGPGIDARDYDGAEGSAARGLLGIPLDEPVVGFLGQIGERKGIADLVRAMPLVWRVVPEAWLVLAGGRTAFVDRVQEIVREELAPAQRSRVKLLIDVAPGDKAGLLRSFDVFASPSGFESFGITYVEAWATSRPVIGCRAGAVPSVVSHGEDGLLVGYGSPSELAGAIVELLLDAPLAARLGAAGRRKALERHTWQRSVARLDDLYLTLAGGRA